MSKNSFSGCLRQCLESGVTLMLLGVFVTFSVTFAGATAVPVDLRNVLPRMAMNNSGDSSWAYIETAGQPGIARPLSKESANYFHSFFGELRHPVSLSSIIGPLHSPFSSCVCYVLGASSCKEMIWPHARRGIAMMTNLHSFGDLAMVQFVRKTMGTNASVSPTSRCDCELAIAFTPVIGTSPQPTAFGLTNMLPKTQHRGNTSFGLRLVAGLTAKFSAAMPRGGKCAITT